MTILSNVKKFFPKVTHVKDANEPILVEVTAKDESISKKRDYKECAV